MVSTLYVAIGAPGGQTPWPRSRRSGTHARNPSITGVSPWRGQPRPEKRPAPRWLSSPSFLSPDRRNDRREQLAPEPKAVEKGGLIRGKQTWPAEKKDCLAFLIGRNPALRPERLQAHHTKLRRTSPASAASPRRAIAPPERSGAVAPLIPPAAPGGNPRRTPPAAGCRTSRSGGHRAAPAPAAHRPAACPRAAAGSAESPARSPQPHG